MAKKRTVGKLPRFNQFSIGKAALLFSYGLRSSEVAKWMYDRYGKNWKISSPEQMHEYLFTIRPGRRPNPERMFAGKSKEEVKRTFKDWLKKSRDQSSRMRKLHADSEFRKRRAEGMRKLNADPEFRRRRAEGMRKLHADPEFAERHRKAAGERMRKLHDNPEFRKRRAEGVRKLNADPEFRKRQAERMRKLHADPEFAERHRKAAGERMRKLHDNPEFRKRQAERMRKLHDNPEFQKRQAERMRKLHADPEFAERHRKASAERMRKLNADPEFAERHRKASGERMRKLHDNPEFRKRQAERMRKLWQNPAWRKMQRELISTALTKHWNEIRTGLRDEFQFRGLLRDVEFEEDVRGRSKPVDILVETHSPTREAEQTERRQVILHALEGLKSLEREAISSIFFEGRTHEQAAALFGMDVTTFEGLLQSAYQKMAPKVRHLL